MFLHDLEQLIQWEGIVVLQYIVDFLSGTALFKTLGQLTQDQPLLIERVGLHSNLLFVLRDEDRPDIAVMVLERNVSSLLKTVCGILGLKHGCKDVGKSA